MQKRNKKASRALRVRSTIKTSGRPRLSVLRTNAHLWVQVIDDQTGRVVAAVSTKTLETAKGTNTEKATAADLQAVAVKLRPVLRSLPAS